MKREELMLIRIMLLMILAGMVGSAVQDYTHSAPCAQEESK